MVERKYVCIDCHNEGLANNSRGRLPKRCLSCNKKLAAKRVSDWRKVHGKSETERTETKV